MKQRTKITCELCGQEISKSNISQHLRRHKNHPETFEQKQWSLTHDGLTCQYCGKECKNRNSLCNHERLCAENPNRQENNLKLSKYNESGHIAWNKGLTKDTDQRVKRNGESVHKFYVDHPNSKGHPCSDESKQKVSASIMKLVKSGKWHTSLAKNMHYQYKGNDLHGTWELKYAQYLDANNISWVRNKRRFKYVYENKLRYYTPDFYLTDTETFVEIKGYKTDKDECKWNAFPKDLNLTVLFLDDLLKLGLNI